MVFVRNSNGTLKARISDQLFAQILADGSGHWRPHENDNPSQTNNAYIIDRGLMFESRTVELFILAGDYLVPEVA